MNPVGLFLVDENQLFREGLKRLLAGTGFLVCGEAKSLKDAQQLLDPDGQMPDVIVIDLADCDNDEVDRLRKLRTMLRSKIVVLAAEVDLRRFVDVVMIGVQGYITKDISFETLVQVLRLAMQDDEIFSTRLSCGVTERFSSIIHTYQSKIDAAQSKIDAAALSSREEEVVRFLSDGRSNKAIARAMAINVASVKIHVRDLLRKLNVKNRTQIAIWAVAHGYSVTELEGDDMGLQPAAAPVRRLSAAE
jgi:two-component system nitrate/nitrite response regulator NarL